MSTPLQNHQKQEKPQKQQKPKPHKNTTINTLRKSQKKDSKNISKKLAKTNKETTFAPATTQTFAEILTRKQELKILSN